MISLDTNVLVRLLVRDDPRQAEQAERLLHKAREEASPCFISDPVLCELEWVLESSYGAARKDVLLTMRDLLGQEIFVFEDRQVLRQAIESYQHGKGDFSDYLIGAKGLARGAAVTYTFDRALRKEPGFVVLA